MEEDLPVQAQELIPETAEVTEALARFQRVGAGEAVAVAAPEDTVAPAALDLIILRELQALEPVALVVAAAAE